MPHPIDLNRNPARPFAAAVGLCAALLILPGARADEAVLPPEEEPRPTTAEKIVVTSLLTETSLRTDDWVFVAKEKNATLADTWTIDPAGEDPILVCKGVPYGYLRTKQQFDDFEMELEWRFPVDPAGNSGILLYTAEEDKIWPKAMQVQLHQPLAGSIFPSGDAKADNEIRDVRDVARPVNQWNLCQISSTGGTISVEINGKKIGEVTGCRPHKGWIALQSEGSEVHFRRIRIREMPPMAAPDAPIDGTTSRMEPVLPTDQDAQVCGCCWRPAVAIDPGFSARHHARVRTTSYVVHRDTLAADGDSGRRCHCVRLDVASTSQVVVDRGGHRLRRARHRHDGF